MNRTRAILRAAAAALVTVLLAATSSAHDGPPFPVVVDQAFAGRILSIWADPDVGIGTFYVYVEPAEAGADGLGRIELRAVPGDSRWKEASSALEPADEKAPYQLIGEIAFEARGPWTVSFTQPSSGEVLELEIEVTPPGSFGPIDLLWFAGPFLAVGVLWVKGLQRQRAHLRGLGGRALERPSPCCATGSKGRP